MKTYTVQLGTPHYTSYEVECEYIDEEGSYTRLLDADDKPVLMVPTSLVVAIKRQDDEDAS